MGHVTKVSQNRHGGKSIKIMRADGNELTFETQPKQTQLARFFSTMPFERAEGNKTARVPSPPVPDSDDDGVDDHFVSPASSRRFDS